MDAEILLPFLIFATGLVYSSVGHGGASGYLAAMALFSFSPDIMKPTALILNILVASIATWQFLKTGNFSWRIFWPFAITSIPFAFVGGIISLPSSVYKPAIGLILLLTAIRLIQSENYEIFSVNKISIPYAALFGTVIGFLSGSLGIGGGIFLSPLLLMVGWAGTRHTAGISAAFILVNSLAGLIGHYATIGFLPAEIGYLGIAAFIGGSIGSYIGSKKLTSQTLYRFLALILIIAALKMFFF